MVHIISTLAFFAIAAASAALIGAMLATNRVAILAALGVPQTAPALPVSARRVRVRSVRPVAMARPAQDARRAA